MGTVRTSPFTRACRRDYGATARAAKNNTRAKACTTRKAQPKYVSQVHTVAARRRAAEAFRKAETFRSGVIGSGPVWTLEGTQIDVRMYLVSSAQHVPAFRNGWFVEWNDLGDVLSFYNSKGTWQFAWFLHPVNYKWNDTQGDLSTSEVTFQKPGV